MVKVIRQGVYYEEGRLVKESQAFMTSDKKAKAIGNTATAALLAAHTKKGALCADVFAAEEEEYANVVRAADKLGVERFPRRTYLFADPWGDCDFSLSAAKKFGAELVSEVSTASEAYLRECAVAGGELLFGTNVYACGALGALSVVCGGGRLLQMVLGEQVPVPQKACVAVLFRGKPKKGVGPTDVALAIERALIRAGDFGRDKILECLGAGNLSMDFRIGVDTRLSELCYATLWETDDVTREYFAVHGREGDYKPVAPVQPAYYDGGVTVDLGKIEPMISLGNEIYTVNELNADPFNGLRLAEAKAEKALGYPLDFSYALHGGKISVSGAGIDRFASSYETLAEVAEIMRGGHIGVGCVCSFYPSSAAVLRSLAESGVLATLLDEGFTPENGGSANTDGLYACDGSDAEVILDARTIAASLKCGALTPATEVAYAKRWKKAAFDGACYAGSVYHGSGLPQAVEIDYVDRVPMPDLAPLPEHLILGLITAEELARETSPYPDSSVLPAGTVSARAILLDGAEIGWSEALALRECGVAAAISKSFSAAAKKNLIQWGVLPLTYGRSDLKAGRYVLIKNCRAAVSGTEESVAATVLSKGKPYAVAFKLGALTDGERELLQTGGLTNIERRV